MITVITEGHNKDKESRWNSKGYRVNTIAKQENPDKSFHQINWGLVLNKHTQAVVFDLSTCYQSTYKLIYGAVSNNKAVIVLYKSKRYNIIDLRELEIQGINDLFNQAKEEYFEEQERINRGVRLKELQQNTEISTEEMTDYLKYTVISQDLGNTKGQREYNLVDMYELRDQVNWDDPITIHTTYTQVKFYQDNKIPFSREIEADEIVTQFGDLNYMEDFIYKTR